ncbi:MAG: Sporulation lipoprotein, YhcN/YlaJ family [Thermoanaerobacterales bacterium 50_218]|nr:MAG: Sporulation lipoprotein, YhcN/YlaJ family [Thermoanaerobacterales bacterium 50_218]HAA89487.1 hypothetical protein [Peptococcaceae bacterium]
MGRCNEIKWLLIFLLLVLLPFSWGCHTTKESQQVQRPQVTSPRIPEDARCLAEGIADVVVKVPGIRKTTVIVLNNEAFIGLEILKDVKETQVSAIENEVLKRVQLANPELAAVSVTSEPFLVLRLREIASEVKKGTPLSRFSEDLSRIAQRIRDGRR